MKLFTAIASAAVVGASFLVPNPVEARNGWVHVDGNTYAKALGCTGNTCRINRSHEADKYVMQYNCDAWTYKSPNGNWNPVMPGSVGEFEAKMACR